MQLKLNTDLLAILASLASAMPAEGEVSVSKLATSQVPYSCQFVPANVVGRCRNEVTELRRRELRGCNVWSKCYASRPRGN